MNEKIKQFETLNEKYKAADFMADQLQGYNKAHYKTWVRKTSEAWENLKNFINENIKDMELIHALEENRNTKVNFTYAYRQVIADANQEQIYEQRGW